MKKEIFQFLSIILICSVSNVIASTQVNSNITKATGAQPLALQIPAIIKNVQSAGYPIITEVELKDGVYNVTAINAQGSAVNIIVDPQTGKMLKPDGVSKIHFSILDAILQVVEKGYSGIYKVEVTDDGYDVYAIDSNGKEVTLEVNAISGEVSKSWF